MQKARVTSQIASIHGMQVNSFTLDEDNDDDNNNKHLMNKNETTYIFKRSNPNNI